MRALSIACHRHAGPADQCRSDRQQSGEHEHHRLQGAAGRIPGPALPEHRRRRARRPPTRAPVLPNGIQLGAGVRTAADLSHHHPGRPASHRPIPTTSPSRARAISASSRPTAPTPIPAPAISRCRPQGQLVTQDGYAWCSRASPFPPTRISVTINAQGQVNATVAGQHHAADRGPARTRRAFPTKRA